MKFGFDGYKKWSICLIGIAGITTSVLTATYDEHIDGLHKVEIHLASIAGIVAIVGGYCGFQGMIDKVKAQKSLQQITEVKPL